MLKIINTFCSHTNLHGFSYIVQPSRHKIERIFWILSVLISFILTGILIHKLVVESQKNPTIIYTDQNVVNVEDLNFPAVTFCPGLLYKTPCKTIIDYEVIKAELDSGIIKPENLTLDELKFMQLLSLTARDRFLSENYPELKVPTDDFMEQFENFNITSPRFHNQDRYFKGNWLNQYIIDAFQVFSETGICNTFNLPNVDEVYKPNAIFRNYTFKHFFQLGAVNLDYKNEKIIEFYPQKVRGSNSGLLLHFDYIMSCENDKEYNCFDYTAQKSDIDGFSLKFHDPYEIVSDVSNFIMIPEKQIVLGIIPKITKIDESLIGDDIEDRNCYFPNEHLLEFFKIYTKVNCEHECFARMTLESCGCVQFFMVRNQTTKICGIFDEKCFRKVEDHFDEIKSSCKCYEACESIKYEVELTNIEEYYEKDFSIFSKGFMAAKISFSVDSVFATSRKKSQTAIQFLSFVGGLLGLFAGFSVLSGAEILYYFVAVPLLQVKRGNLSRVYPLNESKNISNFKKKTLKYLKEVLGVSTIHSFRQIGSEEKSYAEIAFWTLLFIISMVLASFMIENVYGIYKESKITMRYEGSATNVENVPFPAFTIVRDLEMLVYELYTDNISGIDHDDQVYKDHVFTQFFHIVCSALDNSYKYEYSNEFEFKSNSDLFGILKYFTFYQPKWFPDGKILWNGRANPPFTEVLTSTLLGYTFNLVEQTKLLNMELVSSHFNYTYGTEHSATLPWKTSVGENKGLSLKVDMKVTHMNHMGEHQSRLNRTCIGRNSIFIHPSNELPIGIEQTSLSRGSYSVLITPEIVKADEDLRSLDVSIRKCYFDDERKLRFFKIYTQKNCELECLSHIIYDKCRCIPYNFIRNSSVEICNHNKTNFCSSRFTYFTNFRSFEHFYETYGTCQCLPLCTFVRYKSTIIKDKYNRDHQENNTFISVKWKDSEYFALVRYQQLRLVDFLSYVGGILGLFAGISVLSIFELFYFLTLRLVTDLIRYFRR